MALRSLDNALPIKSERPKKPSVKFSSPLAKVLSPFKPGPNDENAAPAAPTKAADPPVGCAAPVEAHPIELERPKKPAAVMVPSPVAAAKVQNNEDHTESAPPKAPEQSVEYVASEDLQALSDPESKVKGLMAEFDSKDWTKVCEALNDVRRLALHHASLLLPILENVMLVIVKAMKNPRSALCKTAIMASADIFCYLGHTLLSTTSDEATAFDHLLLQLLLKASQDKRFVCEEAEKALEKLAAGSVSPLPLLKKLHSYVGHSNPRVRAKAAVAISNCLAKLSNGVKREFGLATLLQIAAGMLNDRLPEAREAARSIVGSVHSGFVEEVDTEGEEEQHSGGATTTKEEEGWQSFCSSNLPPISAQAVAKIVSQ